MIGILGLNLPYFVQDLETVRYVLQWIKEEGLDPEKRYNLESTLRPTNLPPAPRYEDLMRGDKAGQP